MFPFDLDEDDELELSVVATDEDTVETLPEYEIDFATMTLTGRLITGIDAVKQWVRICLEVPRYQYTQYSWAYGHEFENLIGKAYTEKELKPIMERLLTEALSQNTDITGIQDLTVIKKGSKVTTSFKISTVYGDTDIQKDFDL